MKVKQVLGSRRVRLLAVAILFIGLIGAIGFAYWEMKQLRRDLYAVRGDYYAYSNDDYIAMDDPANATVRFDILSQEVKKLPVEDSDYYSTKEEYDGPKYVDKNVRVVKVRITNDQDWIYSHYGNIGYQSSNGIIVRSIAIDPKADMNPENIRGSFELGAKGSIEYYLYFTDTGDEIEKIENMDLYGV